MSEESEDKKLMQKEGQVLPLMETFYSIQGEGAKSGQPAFFARLGGCDVGCCWCDTRESWTTGLHPLTPAVDIVQKALEYPARTVVITGGEPLACNMAYLTRLFREEGFYTCLETSGTEPLSGTWDWICLSPKANTPPLPGIYPNADELKVIIYENDDYRWALECSKLVNPGCRLFLQPEWSRRAQVMPGLVGFILAHPEWSISLQIHKYMKIP